MAKAALTATLFLSALAACSDSTTAPMTNPLLGRYALTAVNGTALPALFTSGDTIVTYTADTLDVMDSTYSQRLLYQVAIGSTTTQDTAATTGGWTHTSINYTFFSETFLPHFLESEIYGTLSTGSGPLTFTMAYSSFNQPPLPDTTLLVLTYVHL